jgi:hypothetical protein
VDVRRHLYHARISKHLSLQQVGTRTALSPSVLKNIDEGRFELLPSGVYARSYVRTFAAEVGLDPESTLAQLEHLLPGAPDPLPALSDMKSRSFEGLDFGLLDALRHLLAWLKTTWERVEPLPAAFGSRSWARTALTPVTSWPEAVLSRVAPWPPQAVIDRVDPRPEPGLEAEPAPEAEWNRVEQEPLLDSSEPRPEAILTGVEPWPEPVFNHADPASAALEDRLDNVELWPEAVPDVDPAPEAVLQRVAPRPRSVLHRVGPSPQSVLDRVGPWPQSVLGRVGPWPKSALNRGRAAVIDALVLLAVDTLLVLLISLSSGVGVEALLRNSGWALGAFCALPIALYFVLFEGIAGTTLGRRACSLVDPSPDHPLTLPDILRRAVFH